MIHPTAAGSKRQVRLDEPVAVIPGPGLDPRCRVDRSNNNLDVVRHDGRLWLAWRTAPTHFASSRACLQVVVSDDDGRTWTLDHVIGPGRDVREPRLVSWQGRLLLYWFAAGSHPLRFEPDRIWVARRRSEAWDDARPISPADCVVWRVRPLGNRLAMSLYRGAGSMFTADPVPLTVELWGSTDGLRWGPYDPERPVVHHGGSETEFTELPDGRTLWVVRKEGPDAGWGADIGVSEPDDPTRLRLRPDPRKLDSPLLFTEGDGAYLVTRRQDAFGGRFDLGWRRIAPSLATRAYQVLYWMTPKRTSLYEVDPDSLALDRLTDLPSAGDTAFAGEVSAGHRRRRIFNYSSPFERRRWPWVRGQVGPTHIYSIDVAFGS